MDPDAAINFRASQAKSLAQPIEIRSIAKTAYQPKRRVGNQHQKRQEIVEKAH
jgi:hypothetical protein